jgi:hypothetical protein
MAGHSNYRITLDMYVGTIAGILDRARAATDELPHGSWTGDPIGFFWKGTGSSDQESQEVLS